MQKWLRAWLRIPAIMGQETRDRSQGRELRRGSKSWALKILTEIKDIRIIYV